MKNYIITTDTTADLPDTYLQENEIGLMSLTYTIDGETYDHEHELDEKVFYEKMRNGSMPTTSQVNPTQAKEVFASMLDKYDADILHIAFSSGLSGSFNSARIAAEELMEERPEHKIVVVDSLCASLGEGLLVHKALQLKKKGTSLEEAACWLEENKLNLCHIFTVDDLFHLYRGGRVSKTTAVLGSMISIKPILHVDEEGHLIPMSKVRGRKKSILAMVDEMEKRLAGYDGENDIFFISHGDCLEDATLLADKIKEKFHIENVLINNVGPTIGAHSGPGTLALFFMGNKR